MNEQNVKKLSFQKKKGNVQKISYLELKFNDEEFRIKLTFFNSLRILSNT